MRIWQLRQRRSPSQSRAEEEDGAADMWGWAVSDTREEMAPRRVAGCRPSKTGPALAGSQGRKRRAGRAGEALREQSWAGGTGPAELGQQARSKGGEMKAFSIFQTTFECNFKSI